MPSPALVSSLLILCGSIIIVVYQPLISDLAWWRAPAAAAPPWGLADCAIVVLVVGGVQFGFAHLRKNGVYTGDILLLSMLLPLLAAMTALLLVRSKGREAVQHLDLDVVPLSARLWIAVRAYLGFVPVFFLTAMTSLVVVYGVANALGYRLPPKLEQSVIRQLVAPGLSPGLRVVLWGYAALGAPVCEEVLFRGLLYGALRRYLDWRWAAGVSGVIFGIIHADLWRFAPLAVMGVFLVVLRERTKSLVVPMCVHAFHNSVMLLMLGIGGGS